MGMIISNSQVFHEKTCPGSIAFYSLLSSKSFMPVNTLLGVFLRNGTWHSMAMKFLFKV